MITMRAVLPTINLLFSPAPWWTVEVFSIPAIVGGIAYHRRYTRKARS